MDNENEIFEAEVENEEKEVIDAEVVDNIDNDDNYSSNDGFDPNVVLQTIMQSQDQGLRNVVLKLSTLNVSTKAAVILLLQQLGLDKFIPGNIGEVINTVLLLLSMLGIIVDPTTKGVGDSQIVLDGEPSDSLKDEIEELNNMLDAREDELKEMSDKLGALMENLQEEGE